MVVMVIFRHEQFLHDADDFVYKVLKMDYSLSHNAFDDIIYKLFLFRLLVTSYNRITVPVLVE